MNNELAEKLNPEKHSNTERQQVIEKMVFNPAKPDPELWQVIIPALEKEPVRWIQQLEARLLRRLPFHIDFLRASFSLLDSTHPSVRLEAAKLIQQVVDRLASEKNKEALKIVEEALLSPLVLQLKREELAADQNAWIALYKTLSFLSGAPAVSKTMVDLLPKGDGSALLVFSQYLQAEHPVECLEPLLENVVNAKSESTAIHLLRGLGVSLRKAGGYSGYASSEPIIQALLSGLNNKSEDVRREAANVLATRAKLAAKEKSELPLEDDVWNALFKLYDERLHMPTARDKDSANLALAALPINQDRLSRLFEVMHRVEDEMEKQSIVGLVGSFKTDVTKTELLRVLRENFAGLHLEAQRIAVESVSKQLPDEEIEVELDKLLEGKGLHSDIMAKLGDKLFSPLPSLKKRLVKWLGLNEKTKRPLLEQFPLPMMHIKVIQAARKLSGDPDIQKRLRALEPLLMMSDAKLRLHEILQTLPPVPESESLKISQVAEVLINKIDSLSCARIVFDGFSLPKTFGESKELEFGNMDQTKALGLSSSAAEMGKDFVKNTIRDLFSEETEIEETEFCLMEEGAGVFTVTALSKG